MARCYDTVHQVILVLSSSSSPPVSSCMNIIAGLFPGSLHFFSSFFPTSIGINTYLISSSQRYSLRLKSPVLEKHHRAHDLEHTFLHIAFVFIDSNKRQENRYTFLPQGVYPPPIHGRAAPSPGYLSHPYPKQNSRC